MKRNYWPLFFIGIFLFTFSMIVWTISSAVKVPVSDDKSFLRSYQDVDANYNDIINSNKDFLSKYDLTLVINDKTFGLTTEDIKYSQRVLEKFSLHKNLLKFNKQNDIKIFVIDKNTKEKKIIDIDLKITKSSSNDFDILFKNENFINTNNEYVSNFKIIEENNWNITGTFTVDGIIGSIFIKTNAI